MDTTFYGLIIKDGVEGLTENNLVRLWHSVGWTDESVKVPDRLFSAMIFSSTVFTAWHDGTLIGLCSAIDDGLNAWISRMVVDKDYQNSGIGSVLVNKMIHKYKDYRIYVQTNHAAEFYKKHGFKECMTNLKLDGIHAHNEVN